MTTSACGGTSSRKSSWPELLGKLGKEAKLTIERENGEVDAVIIVPEGSPVISDFRCDRVWVRVNKSGIVTEVPKLG